MRLKQHVSLQQFKTMVETFKAGRFKKIPRALVYVADARGQLHYCEFGSLLDQYGIKPKMGSLQAEKEDKIRRSENLNIEN